MGVEVRFCFLGFQTQVSLLPLPMHSPSDPLFSHLWNGYSDDYIIDSK